MPANLYAPTYFLIIFALSMFYGLRYYSSPGYVLQTKWNDSFWPLVLTIILTFWLGFRPMSWVFGDTLSYVTTYENLTNTTYEINWHKEWIWELFQIFCRESGFSARSFLILVEAGYMFFTFWAIKRLLPSHTMLAMLFVYGSLMYFTFGTNGIRNGLACQIVLLAFSYIIEKKLVPAIVLFLISFGIHRSTILPIVSILTALYLIKDPKTAIYFWIACIPMSLVAGGFFEGFFAGLGFDDRMTIYSADNQDMTQFSKTGFRWDFLIFSTAPVALAWIVIVKKQCKDYIFNLLVITYCLSNAFWILIIRAPFSNRFAYLSWFIMPIVIAYPLINMAVWEDQDRKTGQILMGYCSFTLVMQFLWGNI